MIICAPSNGLKEFPSQDWIIEIPPFIFPAFLALIDLLFPEKARSAALFAIQALCWLATPNILVAACRRYNRGMLSVVWPFAMLIGCVSLHLLTTHGLTETLFVFGAAICCYLIARKSASKFGLLLALSLLACIRPMYLVHVAIWFACCLKMLAQMQSRRRAGWAALMLGISPIGVQMAFVFAATGNVQFSAGWGCHPALLACQSGLPGFAGWSRPDLGTGLQDHGEYFQR